MESDRREAGAIVDVSDLEVFRKAYGISLEVHEQSLKFPKHEQYNGLADQMRRASKGICGNLAEGFGKQSISKAEFKRFIAMAIGSADEMQVWLKYCQDLRYIDKVQSQTLINVYQEIAKMLSGLHKNWI